jgi:hypothetical protein
MIDNFEELVKNHKEPSELEIRLAKAFKNCFPNDKVERIIAFKHNNKVYARAIVNGVEIESIGAAIKDNRFVDYDELSSSFIGEATRAIFLNIANK